MDGRLLHFFEGTVAASVQYVAPPLLCEEQAKVSYYPYVHLHAIRSS